MWQSWEIWRYLQFITDKIFQFVTIIHLYKNEFVGLVFLSPIFQNRVYFFKQYADHFPLPSQNPQWALKSVKLMLQLGPSPLSPWLPQLISHLAHSLGFSHTSHAVCLWVRTDSFLPQSLWICFFFHVELCPEFILVSDQILIDWKYPSQA